MEGDNSHALRAVARRQRGRLFALCLPALALGTVVLFVPIIWLVWQSFLGENGSLTLRYYTQIVNEGAYLAIIGNTFEVSVLVTLCCILLGYPLAYMLVLAPPRIANLLLLGVLAPFWTSILVRTYAWIVLLQRHGVVNDALVGLGVIDEPIQLVNNFTGTMIGMVHIMLPYMVLPLYGGMRAIDGSYMRAAANLGASPARAFWTVHARLSLPGFLAGLVLVFVLCLGFYITPAMLGGGHVIMIAQRIADSVSLYPTWGPASALGVVLLVLTFGVLGLSLKLIGGSRPRVQTS
jgi:putative spermidine/putrescine transport system permease protein/spermidine/putrescine transport system permease protein